MLKINIEYESLSANNVYRSDTLRLASQMSLSGVGGFARKAVMIAMNQSELQRNSVIFLRQGSQNEKNLECHANESFISYCFCDLEHIFLYVAIDKIENVECAVFSLMRLNVKVSVFFDMLAVLNEDGLQKACVLSERGVSVGISGCVDVGRIYDHIFSSRIFDFIEISIPDNMCDDLVYNRMKDEILYLKENFGVEAVLSGRGASVNALSATGCWGVYL